LNSIFKWRNFREAYTFNCLQRIINKKLFNNYERLTTEKDFSNIHSDSRWQTLVDTLKKSQKNYTDNNFNGVNTLYNSHRQITKQGTFKNGKLIEGKYFIYNSDYILERINFYKDGKFLKDSIIH
jgi:antitoxin component YwqK of YwqJK toxin-antitoxin module